MHLIVPCPYAFGSYLTCFYALQYLLLTCSSVSSTNFSISNITVVGSVKVSSLEVCMSLLLRDSSVLQADTQNLRQCQVLRGHNYIAVLCRGLMVKAPMRQNGRAVDEGHLPEVWALFNCPDTRLLSTLIKLDHD